MSTAHQAPKPATAASGGAAPQDYDNAVQALAASIYVQLVKDAVVVSVSDSGSNASISANPEALAKISYKLAETFLDTGAAIKASAKPKTEVFDVNKMDFGL